MNLNISTFRELLKLPSSTYRYRLKILKIILQKRNFLASTPTMGKNKWSKLNLHMLGSTNARLTLFLLTSLEMAVKVGWGEGTLSFCWILWAGIEHSLDQPWSFIWLPTVQTCIWGNYKRGKKISFGFSGGLDLVRWGEKTEQKVPRSRKPMIHKKVIKKLLVSKVTVINMDPRIQ